MALDPNLKNNIDPNVWTALLELDAKIDALQLVANEPPLEHVMRWADGTETIYRKV